MKNAFKLSGIMALLAVIGVSIIACNLDVDDDDRSSQDSSQSGSQEVLVSEYHYYKNGELSILTEYVYDSKGNITGMRGSSSVSYVLYEYDSKGNMTKLSRYLINGELSFYYLYEYDSKGYRTKRSEYNDGELSFYYQYEYDSKGYLTKESSYNKDGELSGYIVYNYKEL